MSAHILPDVEETELRHALLARLELEGFDVAVAGDGPAALELARREAFDCLVLDGALPYSSGHALLGQLRARRVDLPMVLLTVLTALAGASAIVAGLMLFAGTFDADDFSIGATTEYVADDWWVIMTGSQG